MNESSAPSILVILANNSLPPFILAMALGIPSAILYTMELALILRKGDVASKELKSPFFTLFAVRAFSSLLGFVFAFLGQRFGRVGWFLPVYLQLSRLCLATFYFLVTYAFHLENVSTAVLLTNRLCSIIFPTTNEKFWKRRLRWIVCLIFIVPLPFTWHIFTVDEYVRIQMDNVTFTLDNHPRENQPNDAEIRAWSSVIFTIVCLTINLGTLLAYRLHYKATAEVAGSQQQQQQNNINKKLTIYTLATFFAQLLYAIYMILIYMTVKINQIQKTAQIQLMFLAIYNQLPWVNDLCTIVLPAWLILWASVCMRKQFLKSIFAITKYHSAQVSANSNNNFGVPPAPPNLAQSWSGGINQPNM